MTPFLQPNADAVSFHPFVILYDTLNTDLAISANEVILRLAPSPQGRMAADLAVAACSVAWHLLWPMRQRQ